MIDKLLLVLEFFKKGTLKIVNSNYQISKTIGFYDNDYGCTIELLDNSEYQEPLKDFYTPKSVNEIKEQLGNNFDIKEINGYYLCSLKIWFQEI